MGRERDKEKEREREGGGRAREKERGGGEEREHSRFAFGLYRELFRIPRCGRMCTFVLLRDRCGL